MNSGDKVVVWMFAMAAFIVFSLVGMKFSTEHATKKMVLEAIKHSVDPNKAACLFLGEDCKNACDYDAEK